MENFADRLIREIEKKQNPSIIGLDSEFSELPLSLRKGRKRNDEKASAMLEFNRHIIDSIENTVPAVKIQSAFYEKQGPPGMEAFLRTVEYAKSKGLIVVADVKRSDIGNTSAAYSSAFLGDSGFGLDCITVNPYLGSDGVLPFVKDVREGGKGIFVLVKTSNPSSSEIQDLETGGKKIYEVVAGLVEKWGSGSEGKKGYRSVGAVVGATYPREAKSLRKLMPKSIFLVPGYGAQGGGADDAIHCFNSDGLGAIVNSSRGVIFSYKKKGTEDYASAASEAAENMKKELTASMKRAGICPW